MSIDATIREKKALDLLDAWPWEFGGVLIGGYAIAAYGRPRYSEDVDMVVPNTTYRELEDFITGQGLILENHSIPNPQNYEGMVFRYRTEELTLDILVGYVRDREARIDIPERWISESFVEQRLITMTGRTFKKIHVARPEALWALKLQSGRDQDITDLFAISSIKIDSNRIIDLFTSLRSESLIDKLNKTLKKIQSRKLYEDSMSRMESKRTEKNKKDWDRFLEQVQFIVSNIIK